MSSMGKRHEATDENGIGLCSVPMWCGGGPAGLCNKPAYGKRPPGRTVRDAYTGEVFRTDGRYNGHIPGLACPIHGGPDSLVYMDGNAWCAVYPDFINLQESPAGFGDTPEEARAALVIEKKKQVNNAS